MAASALGMLAMGALPARAEGWVVGEVPAAVAVSDAQEGVFRPGVMPAVGAYTDNGWLALGARLRAGVLRNGPAPGDNFADPGLGGLGTAGLALRVHRRGAWVELVGGGGVTGHDVLPAFEVGAGWDFAIGDLGIGPGVRYIGVVARDPMAAFGSASLIVGGLDVRWGTHDRARELPHVAEPAPARIAAVPPPPPAPAPAVPLERDPDRIVEHEASCAEQLDGCRLSEHLVVKDDRIVLDERVLFEFGRAKITSEGRDVIAEIAKVWREHPEWKRLTIEGHTDAIGTDEFNQTLSERRAQFTRRALLRHGFDPARVDAVGYGRSRPRDPGSDAAANSRNRRVEFVIEREVTP